MKFGIKKGSSPDTTITAILFIVLIALLAMQVFLRYVVNKSVSWSEEVSRWFFIWIIYFGCMLAAKDEKHIRVTVQLNKLPKKVQKIVITIGDLIWVAFSIALGVLGLQMVLEMFRYPIRSNTTGLNMVFVYAIIPISFFTMAVWVIRSIIRRFKGGDGFELGDSRLDVD
jgi:TRAP-type C4-dicarboxylate transport system permease small subunit